MIVSAYSGLADHLVRRLRALGANQLADAVRQLFHCLRTTGDAPVKDALLCHADMAHWFIDSVTQHGHPSPRVYNTPRRLKSDAQAALSTATVGAPRTDWDLDLARALHYVG